MEKKISIIIPIFNMEKYLEECLSSILIQNYENYEAIMIEDGSTDKSKKICEKYSKLDARFKLIVQKNSGASLARNNGIKVSDGELIIFIDADDYIENGTLKKINDNIKEYDFLCFGFYCLYKNVKKEVVLDDKILDKNKIYDNIYLNNNIGGFMCNKVFKSKIIKENNILLNKDFYYCEDLSFVSEYLKYCNNCCYLNDSLYFYRMRKSSATKSLKDIRKASVLSVYENLISKHIELKKYQTRFEYVYLLNYYKLKKVVKSNKFCVNNIILSHENSVLKKASTSQKIKFYIIKFLPFLYYFCIDLKNKYKNKLFN